MKEAEKIFIRFTSKINKGYPDYTIRDREGFIKEIQDFAEQCHKQKIRDELIKFMDYERRSNFRIIPVREIDEYLKSNSKLTNLDVVVRKYINDER